MTSEIKKKHNYFGKLMDEAVKTHAIPNVADRTGFWNKKILGFLDKFEINEVRELKCANKDEQKYLFPKMKRYSTKMLPKVFIVAQRKFDDGYYIYIQRKGDVK